MNRFKINKKILTPMESLIYWTLKKRGYKNPIENLDRKEFLELIKENESRIQKEFSSIFTTELIDELIRHSAELEAENYYLQIELAKADFAEGADNIYKGKDDTENLFNVRKSFFKLLNKAGNRFVSMAENSVSKEKYYLTSKGGKSKGFKSQEVKDDIRDEFINAKDSFKIYGFTSRFCVKMKKKHRGKLSKLSIDRYVARLKKEFL